MAKKESNKEDQKFSKEETKIAKAIAQQAQSYIDEQLGSFREAVRDTIREELKSFKPSVSNNGKTGLDLGGAFGSEAFGEGKKADKAFGKILALKIIESLAPSIPNIIQAIIPPQQSFLNEFMLRKELAFTYSTMNRDRAIWEKLVSEGKVDRKYLDDTNEITKGLIDEPLMLMVRKLKTGGVESGKPV